MKYLIIGLGAERSNTVSLCKMLNQIPSSFFVHEGFMLPWYGKEKEALFKLEKFLDSTEKKYVGDVGFYWLPYVECVLKQFPDAKFICLKRDKEETIKSFLKKTEGRNHWIKHDGKKWKNDYIWDRCFPKYEVEDKEEALKLYWEEYYNRASYLEKKYPKNFRIFNITVLNSSESFMEILDFIGAPKCNILPKKENILISKRSEVSRSFSLIERIKKRWFEEKKLLPWRLEQKIAYRGGLLNTVLLSPLRRNIVLRYKTRKVVNNDVTVVLPIKNVDSFRLWHSLSSIYNQNYKLGKIFVIVIDYGSNYENIKEYLEIIDHFNYKYIYLNRPPNEWSRTKALNIGIRNAKTPFVASTDVDIMFSSLFFQRAITLLRKDPFSVVYSYCLDLPEEVNDELVDFFNKKQIVDVSRYRNKATKRWESQPSYGICVTYKVYYELIGGYDEFFQGWGSEDDDLYKRFFNLGLNPKVIFDEDAFYCHIWHEKWGGVLTELKLKMMERNYKYSKTNKNIYRNDDYWGLI
ncbi:MAG: galactosyltransferase-related protein [Desulfonauticus sp.]|nr:galactosyltransferase-related protein [Desulfonauticus sp.]